MGEQMTTERFARLEAILRAAHYNGNGIATISREMVGEIQLTLKDAQAEIDALTAERDEARAQIAALTPDAEAWRYKQACKAWDAGKITPFEFAEAYKLYSPQARRAREARS